MRPGAVPRILTFFLHNYKTFVYKFFLGAKSFSKFSQPTITHLHVFSSRLFLNGNRFIALYVSFYAESNVLLK